MGACFGKSNDEQVKRENASHQQQANGTASQRAKQAQPQGQQQQKAQQSANATANAQSQQQQKGVQELKPTSNAAVTSNKLADNEQPNVVVHEDPASKKTSESIRNQGAGTAAAVSPATSNAHAAPVKSDVEDKSRSQQQPDLGDASTSGVDSKNLGSTQQLASPADLSTQGADSVSGKIADKGGVTGAVVAGAVATAATATGISKTLTAADLPKATIYIVYYSTYGHIEKLAHEVEKGVQSFGANVKLFQIPETLPDEVLNKMHAKEKDPSIPLVAPSDLTAADGVIFGVPTRFGQNPAQVKALLDSTGQLWAKGALLGKPATIFFSTATQAGGQESTAMTFITQLTHHGMIYVPIGYSNPSLFSQELHGGSPYGAGTHAGGDGSRQPSALELNVAQHEGRHFAEIATQLKVGRHLTAKSA